MQLDCLLFNVISFGFSVLYSKKYFYLCSANVEGFVKLATTRKNAKPLSYIDKAMRPSVAVAVSLHNNLL